ncbi:unnamed protein product [Brugia timori]|uniref:Uncharacterized protein n=1 Tax=Brugia timori TaxID=42155 RepID=A0A0R3Q337_9BILA|nr:unnamed protein product [Brugia timori]
MHRFVTSYTTREIKRTYVISIWHRNVSCTVRQQKKSCKTRGARIARPESHLARAPGVYSRAIGAEFIYLNLTSRTPPHRAVVLCPLAMLF